MTCENRYKNNACSPVIYRNETLIDILFHKALNKPGEGAGGREGEGEGVLTLVLSRGCVARGFKIGWTIPVSYPVNHVFVCLFCFWRKFTKVAEIRQKNFQLSIL